MSIDLLYERLLARGDRVTDTPIPPPPELVAFCIIVGRRMMAWKQSTLAAMAGVSLSTIERAERAEAVSAESLEKIGAALDHPPGAFTDPRFPLDADELRESLAEWRHVQAVKVAPFRRQNQIRAAIAAEFFLVHRPGVPDEASEDITALVESLDLGSFMYGDYSSPNEVMPRRDYYAAVQSCIDQLVKRRLQVSTAVIEIESEPVLRRDA